MKKLIFSIIPLLFMYGCELKSSRKEAQIRIGHYLFFDTRLSLNNSKSCASCHDPKLAFTDGYRTSVTSLGENLLHNSPSLLNLSSSSYYDWANPEVKTLSQQMKRPLYSEHPIELGLHIHFEQFTSQLKKDSIYQNLFQVAFDNKATFSKNEIETCINQYENVLIATNSKYDSVLNKRATKFSPSEQHGMKLFMSAQLNCSSCHRVPFISNLPIQNQDSSYANIGLYFIYPKNDNGLIAKTNKKNDEGKFKIPNLRNVAITSPYMHDGSVASLHEVIDNYARGGRLLINGQSKGDGKYNQFKDKRITGFSISIQEKKDLIAFLETLTDTSYLSNPLFLNPFTFNE